MTPALSVIVCTYNRADFLAKCLDSLAAQAASHPDVEILVVDNNSSDATSRVVEEFKARIAGLRCVFEPAQGLSHARNRGCREARAPFLLYLDDDAMAPAGYLDNVRRVMREHDPDILGGPITPYYLTPKPWWFRDEYEVRRHAETSGFLPSCRASGGNFGIRKSVLEKVGLFDVGLGMIGDKVRLGEERAVTEAYARGLPERERRAYYSQECRVLHYVPPVKMTFSYLFGRYYQAGLAEAKMQGRRSSTAAVLALGLAPLWVAGLARQVAIRGWRADPLIPCLRTASRVGRILGLWRRGPLSAEAAVRVRSPRNNALKSENGMSSAAPAEKI